jgi:hypothetical protein
MAPKEYLFGPALRTLQEGGQSRDAAASLLGKIAKHLGDEEAANAVRKAIAERPLHLPSRLAAVLKRPRPRRAADADLASVDYGSGIPQGVGA